MTREEAKKYLMNISYQLGTMSIEHLSEKDGEKMREAINALEQQPCTDAISRQAAIDLAKFDGRENLGSIIHAFDVEQLPPVIPAEKMGRWILVQREKYVDINCSECGHTRIKEYAYNYTVNEIDIQEIKDMVVTDKLNYCECCGVKMLEVK